MEIGRSIFLGELPHLIGFVIIDWNINDISAIQALHLLRYLQVRTYCDTAIDFEQFPLLEECSLEWRPKTSSLFSRRSLKRLCLNKYIAQDTADLAKLTKLQSLTIASSTLEDLRGLGALRELEHLALYNLTRLRSLAGVESLSSLKELDVKRCRSIGSITPVANLTSLTRIYLADCGPIESLAPLVGLTHLEWVIFYESTNILDGDLSPLKRLPCLKKVAFRERRHYSHSRADFVGLT